MLFFNFLRIGQDDSAVFLLNYAASRILPSGKMGLGFPPELESNPLRLSTILFIGSILNRPT